jgi:dolichol-phosphate mannosyltransferase
VTNPDLSPSAAERWRHLGFTLLALSILVRLLCVCTVELLPEEAYYWNYAQHLDIGYLDHPPMVAWLIRLGTAVFGNTEIGVRIGAVLCGGVASVFVYQLTRNLFGAASALTATLFMQLLPFCFCSGFLMTPDAPLTAAWAATLFFLERALIAGRVSGWWGAGISVGLGLLSKYTIAMLMPAAFVFMLLDPDARRWLRHWAPYVAAVLALALFTPVIIWNARHEWISFAFQTSHRLAERPRFSLHKLLVSALVLLTPVGFVTIFGALRSPKSLDAREQRARRFLLVCVALPFTVYFLFSLQHEVKLDWTGTVWIAALPALARIARGRVGTAWAATLAVLLLVYAVALDYLVLGIPGIGYSEHMEVSPVGWRDLGRQVSALAYDERRKTGVEPLVVGMDRYATASELAFYAPDRERAVAQTSASHLFGGAGLMYEQWFPLKSSEGRTLLLVALKPQDLADPSLESHADRLEAAHEGVLLRHGKVVHRCRQQPPTRRAVGLDMDLLCLVK